MKGMSLTDNVPIQVACLGKFTGSCHWFVKYNCVVDSNLSVLKSFVFHLLLLVIMDFLVENKTSKFDYLDFN